MTTTVLFAVGSRALTLGRFWRRDGVLAVSVAQEGVIRGKNIAKINDITKSKL